MSEIPWTPDPWRRCSPRRWQVAGPLLQRLADAEEGTDAGSTLSVMSRVTPTPASRGATFASRS